MHEPISPIEAEISTDVRKPRTPEQARANIEKIRPSFEAAWQQREASNSTPTPLCVIDGDRPVFFNIWEFEAGYIIGLSVKEEGPENKFHAIGERQIRKNYTHPTESIICSTALSYGDVKGENYSADPLLRETYRISGNNAIEVDYEYQGKGLGRDLYDLTMLLAQKTGVSIIDIRDSNPESQRVIRNLGYRIIEDHQTEFGGVLAPSWEFTVAVEQPASSAK